MSDTPRTFEQWWKTINHANAKYDRTMCHMAFNAGMKVTEISELDAAKEQARQAAIADVLREVEAHFGFGHDDLKEKIKALAAARKP